MLKSNTSIVDGFVIFDLNIEDLYIPNYHYVFSEFCAQKQKLKVLFNLEGIDVLTSSDLLAIQKVVDTLHLGGIKTAVCGINPHSASLIYTFSDEVGFSTYLNVQDALDAF